MWQEQSDIAGVLVRVIRSNILHMQIITMYMAIYSDLTSPTVEFQDTPSAITSETSSTFRFRCVNEYRCTYLCTVHAAMEMPQFTPCYGTWHVSDLQRSISYVFSVVATDAVGNLGSVVNYPWRIGESFVAIDTLN